MDAWTFGWWVLTDKKLITLAGNGDGGWHYGSFCFCWIWMIYLAGTGVEWSRTGLGFVVNGI
jgi:hypothetical protein